MQSEYKLQLGTIEDNLDSVKAEIEQRTNELSGTIVTPENIMDSKKFLAEIRKEKKELDDVRKEIKKAWMKPFEVFEKKVKAVVALYDVPINAIDQQLKQYEEARKADKLENVKYMYNENIPPELVDYLPFDKVFNPRWLNASTSGKAIIDDLQTAVIDMRGKIDAVKSIESKWEAKGLETLAETGDLKSAIQIMKNMQEQAEYIMELERVAVESVAEVQDSFVDDVPTFIPSNGPLVFYSVDVPCELEREFIDFCNSHHIGFERM